MVERVAETGKLRNGKVSSGKRGLAAQPSFLSESHVYSKSPGPPMDSGATRWNIADTVPDFGEGIAVRLDIRRPTRAIRKRPVATRSMVATSGVAVGVLTSIAIDAPVLKFSKQILLAATVNVACPEVTV